MKQVLFTRLLTTPSLATVVLAGKITHRDAILSAVERAEGKKMLVCVSRGEGSLTLDL
jgi:hypothetical protein